MHDMLFLGEDAVFIYDLKIGNGTERALGDGVRCFWLWGQEEKVSVVRQCGVGLAIIMSCFCLIIMSVLDVDDSVMRFIPGCPKTDAYQIP